jgi:hypothetical protein
VLDPDPDLAPALDLAHHPDLAGRCIVTFIQRVRELEEKNYAHDQDQDQDQE